MNISNLIIECVRHNVLGSRQLKSRVIGFRAELEFAAALKSINRETFSGGMFIPNVVNSRPLKNSIYITFIQEGKYLGFYKWFYSSLTNLGPFPKYIITYGLPKYWHKGDLPKPNFKLFRFQLNRFIEEPLTNIFSKYVQRDVPYPLANIDKETIDYCKRILGQPNYSSFDLIQIYVERYFFDTMLANKFKIGIPTDIDLIYCKRNGEPCLVEIKEKDLAKRIKGFGLDIPRLNDILYISKQTGLDYVLIVRQIKNQVDRMFMNWRGIKIQDFKLNVEKSIIEGGKGMRSTYSSNPTVICSEDHFKTIRL